MTDLEFREAGLGADAIDYLEAWELQRQVHAAVTADERPGTVLLTSRVPTPPWPTPTGRGWTSG